jgi:hypothetical protein
MYALLFRLMCVDLAVELRKIFPVPPSAKCLGFLEIQMRIQLLPVVAIVLLTGCANFPEQSHVPETAQNTVQSAAQSTDQGSFQAKPQINNQINEPIQEAPQSGSTPSPEVALAAYLNESGAVLYDAENCTYCRKQQRMFGSAAFQQLKVVNCGPWNEPYRECRRIGIRTFPTWEIGGRRYPTILPLAEIAELSGFNRSTDAARSGEQGGPQ